MTYLKQAFSSVTARKSNLLIYSICIIYVVGISIFMLAHRMWLSPDQFFLVAIVAAIAIGGLWRFLRDWTPFILLFLSYEYMRGLAPLLNKSVHITEMINADKYLFGFVPTIKLQAALFHPGNPQWYDFVSIIFYMMHFIVPMVTAFTFWLISKKTFREFTLALIILSFAGFTTYVIFPAMPPWLAAQHGFLPPIHKVMDAVVANLGQPLALPTAYKFFRGNEIAAMPSLHAAYPLLVSLFAIRYFKKPALLLLPYVFGVWFAVVYMGEHYAIDVIVGALYAATVFLLVIKRSLIFEKLFSLKPLKAFSKLFT